MKLLYFSWVRQKVGTGEEAVALPANVTTIAELIEWLKSRGPGYEAAFENLKLIRAAIDQTHAGLDANIAGASEIAFFPPVTGG